MHRRYFSRDLDRRVCAKQNKDMHCQTVERKIKKMSKTQQVDSQKSVTRPISCSGIIRRSKPESQYITKSNLDSTLN